MNNFFAVHPWHDIVTTLIFEVVDGIYVAKKIDRKNT